MPNVDVAMGRVRLFLGLSRAPHAVLDMATPAMAALLWTGRFPSATVVMVGLLTVFAGYMAVYALNDLVDLRGDRDRLNGAGGGTDGYLDALLPSHPLARGLLNRRQAVAWIVAWGIVAAAGAFALNPLCLAVFATACLLEAFYCRLCDLTPCRTLISGVVKTLGPLAAVLVVDPRPDPLRLALLVLWLLFWEIGGQNIPADWADIDADRRLGARTIAVLAGERRAGMLVLASLGLCVVLKLTLVWTGPERLRLPYAIVSLAVGGWLLLAPAIRLSMRPTHPHVVRLFNQASWYPLALLAAVTLRTAAGRFA